MKQGQNSITGLFIILLMFSIIGYAYYNVFFDTQSTAILESSLNENSNSNSEFLNYTILDIRLNNEIGFNISVEISKKLTTDELQSIANNVRLNNNTKSEKGVIFFFLPDMKVDNGAWAAADYKSSFSVRIIGQSIDDEKIIRSNLNKITDYYGLWMDNFMSGAVILRIRKDKKLGYVNEYISPTNPVPEKFPILLKKSMRNNKVTFIDKESEDGNYYEIESNGDLISYDNKGFIARYIKLK